MEYPFRIAKGIRESQPALLVQLTGPTGIKGYGEATAIAYYGEDREAMIQRLENFRPGIQQHALVDPQRYHHYLHHLMGEDPFLISALDMAAWDLFAKTQRKPLYQLFRLPHQHGLQTDYTLGMDSLEVLKEKIQRHPWPIYKIKIDHRDALDTLIALRKLTDAVFRVDANESLDPEDALRLIPEFHRLGVDLLEQPLNREAWEEMGRLRESRKLTLIADESFRGMDDFPLCQKYFDGVNLKIAKLGGISPSLHALGEARKRGMAIMVGSYGESSLGTAAAVPFLGLARYADLDGPLLITKDPGKGLDYPEARPQVPLGEPGLGIQVDPLLFESTAMGN